MPFNILSSLLKLNNSAFNLRVYKFQTEKTNLFEALVINCFKYNEIWLRNSSREWKAKTS